MLVSIILVPQKIVFGLILTFRPKIKISFPEVLEKKFKKLHVKIQVSTLKTEGGVLKSEFFRGAAFLEFLPFI